MCVGVGGGIAPVVKDKIHTCSSDYKILMDFAFQWNSFSGILTLEEKQSHGNFSLARTLLLEIDHRRVQRAI